MANTIQLQEPAKISRNTAADGDFLWNMDFARLWANDQALKDAIEQGTKELTPSSGINIDADKKISVNKGKGLKFNGNALEVDIEGKGGADVTYEGDKIVVSGYDPTELINDVSELADSLDVFSESLEELEEKAITSADSMQQGTQYVYTTSGWVPIAGGSQQEISYWRPTYNSSTGKIEWEMRPSPSMETPLPTDDLRGADGENGKTPKFQINQSTNFWEWKYVEDPETTPWTSTKISATGPRGATGETGAQGFSIELESVETVPGGKEITLKWGDPESPSTSAFIIPSGDKGGQGDPGDKGYPGDNGYTPSVSADDITDVNGRGKKVTFYWPDGPEGKSNTEFNIYHGYSPTIAKKDVIDPQGQHKNGGIEFTINYLDQGTSAIGIIWHGNDGEDGSNSVYTRGPYLSGHGGDPTFDPVGLTDKAIEAIEAVSGKIEPPPHNTQQSTNYIWSDPLGQEIPGWIDANNWLDEALENTDFLHAEDLRWYISPENGISGKWDNEELKLGIDTTNMNAGNQYAFTTNGWEKVAVPSTSGYLPLSGGTVSGQLVVSATSANFDSQYLKLIREGVNGYGRIGLGSNGPLALKVDDSNGQTTQVNISPNATNDQLVQVQHSGTTAYLIPAQIHQGSYTPSVDDKILHIVIEN